MGVGGVDSVGERIRDAITGARGSGGGVGDGRTLHRLLVFLPLFLPRRFDEGCPERGKTSRS